MIKEVANVYFEALADADDGSDVKEGDIVLYLDTLKVSNVETTAESVSAQGGWGNPKLVTWDYGKDINLNLEDAVISWEEMRILMGARMFDENSEDHEVIIRKNAEYVFAKGVTTFTIPVGDGKTAKGKNHFPATAATFGSNLRWVDMTNGKRGTASAVDQDGLVLTLQTSDGQAYEAATVTKDEKVRIRFFWQEKASAEQPANELVISPDTFPGTWAHDASHKNSVNCWNALLG